MQSADSLSKGGRPRIAEYDNASKFCETCGRAFYLRDRKFQSYKRFQQRRFCSQECSRCSPRSERRNYTLEEEMNYILERVSIAENGCWNWLLRKSHNGYGLTQRQGADKRVHRYAFELWKGAIPEGKMILHSCDNRQCCNPDHLRIGTAKENVADAIQRGRWMPSRRKAA